MTKHSTQSHTRKAPDAAAACTRTTTNERGTHEIHERRGNDECGHRWPRRAGLCSRARAAKRATRRIRSHAAPLGCGCGTRGSVDDARVTVRSATGGGRSVVEPTTTSARVARHAAKRCSTVTSAPPGLRGRLSLPAQHVPRDIRAKVFAANDAVGSLLHMRTPLRWHLPPRFRVFRSPSAKERRRHLERFRQARLRATFDGKEFRQLHAVDYLAAR